jgi:hypothetical protein
MNFDNACVREALPGDYKYHHGKQASVLLSNEDFSDLTYSCHNRTVDRRHASSLEAFVKDKAFKGEIVDTLKLAITMEDLCSRRFREQGTVTVYVVDGQHRLLATKNLMDLYPGVTFSFLADVFIYHDVSEIGGVVKALQNALPLSTAQRVGISGRGRFTEALTNVLRRSGEHPNRLCVRCLPMNRRLQDGSPVVSVLRMKTIKEIERMLLAIGTDYERMYRRNLEEGTIRRATQDVIANTKLYQLADTTASWLDRIATFDARARATAASSRDRRRVEVEDERDRRPVRMDSRDALPSGPEKRRRVSL